MDAFSDRGSTPLISTIKKDISRTDTVSVREMSFFTKLDFYHEDDAVSSRCQILDILQRRGEAGAVSHYPEINCT